jgi:diguanylate cyclase (GGDEF)-like protein
MALDDGSIFRWLRPPMDGDFRGLSVLASQEILNRLMPMHLVLDSDGRILTCGETLSRALAGQQLQGAGLWDVFDIRGPDEAGGTGTLDRLAGRKLRVVTRRGDAPFRLRGLLLPLQPGQTGADTALSSADRDRPAWILNLSFGIDLPRAVAQLALTDADFAVTDLAMELLYLAEANVAVTGELRALAQRLEGARLQAREEALTDTLTGLRNRRAFDSVLSRLCREGAAFALMNMDLDFFKAVNDTLGHAAGDHVLMQVAGVLKASARAQDCIARVGGDEFVLLLPGMTDKGLLSALAERVIGQLSRPIPFNGAVCRISASFGYVTVQEGDPKSPSDALAEADVALYAAKKAGRSRAFAFDPAMLADTA